MAIFVDTTVWSLALRRDAVVDVAEVKALKNALADGTQIITTGLVLQELLQGFSGPKAKAEIINRFAAIPFVSPDRTDHIAAAELRNVCRRSGVQVGTIDAILAQLCIRHDLTLLTTDNDFRHMAKHCALRVWVTI
jgi:predicted nucleic acid-binding protein